jgi:hypothetical protein
MEALAAQPVNTPEYRFHRPQFYVEGDIGSAEGPPLDGTHSVLEAEFEPQTQERYRQWLGSIALRHDSEPSVEKESGNTDLLDTIRQARSGLPEARQRLHINVATATAEGYFKDNHVSTIVTRRDQTGKLGQHGQSVDSVQRNAMTMRPNRHPVLQEITKAEALNAHRVEDALVAGKLKDHHLVVFSVVPSGVPKEALGEDGDGYFLDDLTLCIQATTELDGGAVQTQAAFKAGVEAKPEDKFEDLMAKRYDLPALARLYRRLGQEPPTTAVGFLRQGIYIPKDQMQNGVVDVMRWLDEEADIVLGRDIERRPEDYMALILESKRREVSVREVCQSVEEALLKDEGLNTPMQAVERMWGLIKDQGVTASFSNESIEPKVFGADAAPHIIAARQLAEGGMMHQAQARMQKALEEAVITGCGGGSSSQSGELSADGISDPGESSTLRDKHGSRKFTCSNGHVNIRPKDELIPECQHKGCSAQVACK